MEGPSIPELVWAVNAHMFNYAEMEHIVNSLKPKLKHELIEEVGMVNSAYTQTQLHDMTVTELKWLIANMNVDTRDPVHVIVRSNLELDEVEKLARQWFILSEQGVHTHCNNAKEALKWCRLQCQDFRRTINIDIEEGMRTYTGPLEAVKGTGISMYHYGRWRNLKLFDEGEWDILMINWLATWVNHQLDNKGKCIFLGYKK